MFTSSFYIYVATRSPKEDSPYKFKLFARQAIIRRRNLEEEEVCVEKYVYSLVGKISLVVDKASNKSHAEEGKENGIFPLVEHRPV